MPDEPGRVEGDALLPVPGKRPGDLILADPQQNIAGLHTCLEGGATGMHILENPTTSTVVRRLEKRDAIATEIRDLGGVPGR